ncbi:uncharacterized protein [Physcomitrium patens]|uniref:RING-type domain-containing protein n=1 Tax=Physcomitrium patens TaxID=3218 RepID=A0A2K1KCZ3_PHYPA|nr:uncharacterized protein LOC112285092 [Physcomitrium patens]XP_024381395.1 uncharacterized protein LOC112285092 [Physcomitrium patens]PNR51652.1 hypothetical protein PHYPA_010839 [Physcomitrium patens]|eukprot:XP_024381394.1 uncharacterized protein LOC112285092 [Physcomitrella patens]
MGKEEDVCSRGRKVHRVSAHRSSKFDHVRSQTPLRTLASKEPASMWTSESTGPILQSSARSRVGIDNVQEGNRRCNTGCNVNTAGSHSARSGSSSPKTFRTSMSQVSHKIRVFKKAGVRLTSQPDELLAPLGALFIQENATENRRMAILELEESVIASKVVKNVQPLRDLLAADMAGSCGPRKGMANDSVRYAGPVRFSAVGDIGTLNRKTNGEAPKSVKSDDSQGLRFFYARDWMMQTSDEEDEFWDSGSLCGAEMAPRRRTRSSKSEKSPSSSNFATGQATRMESSRVNSLSSLSTANIASWVGGSQEPNVQGPGHVCSRSPEEPKVGCSGPKPSLGTLLAEEVATDRVQSGADLREGITGVGGMSSRWSTAVNTGEGSRRAKIGSLSDISVPVHPESQIRLEYLITKFLTPRTNPIEGEAAHERHEIQSLVGHDVEPIFSTPAAQGTLCSTSGSMQGSVTVTEGEENFLSPTSESVQGSETVMEVDEAFLSPTSESLQGSTNVTEGDENFLSPTFFADVVMDVNVDLSTQSAVDTPNIVLKPSISNVLNVPHSPLLEPTASIGEVLNTVADAVHVDETSPTDRRDIAHTNTVGEGVEAPRVQLGTLLERAREELDWLPLSRSRISSPFLPESQSSSSRSSSVNMVGMLSGDPDANWQITASEAPVRTPHVVVDDSFSGEFRTVEPSLSPDMVHRPEIQHPPNSGTGMEGPHEEAREVVVPTPAREEPPRRVSLLSLLNQDMEMDENGAQAERGGYEDEPDDHVTEQLDPMCCVCMVGHKGAAFIPCGHTFCRRCCREVRRTRGCCPLCKQTIIDVLNIY